MNKTDQWLTDYEVIERLGQTISQKLNERSKHPKQSNQYSSFSANVRVLMNKFSSLTISLSKNLEASNNGNLTQQEFARRCGLVNQLKTNEKQYDKYLRDDSSSFQNNKNSTSNLWGDDVIENDFTNNLSSNQLMAQHDQIIAQQDRGLDTLSHIISNQKQIALTIGNEVDKQNVLIDHIGDKVESVHERLITETKHIKLLDRKSSTCGLWILIVLLLIAIIVIFSLPKV